MGASGCTGRLDLAPCNSFRRFLFVSRDGEEISPARHSKDEGTLGRDGKGGLAHLSVVKLAENERNRTKEDLVAGFERKLQDLIGFRRVIDLIIDPTRSNSRAQLPDGSMPLLPKVRRTVPPKMDGIQVDPAGTAPTVIDTKHIASHLLGLTETSLESLTSMVRSKGLPGTDAFSRQQEHFHDAGYDSLCTGAVFIGLLESLKGKLIHSLDEYIDMPP